MTSEKAEGNGTKTLSWVTQPGMHDDLKVSTGFRGAGTAAVPTCSTLQDFPSREGNSYCYNYFIVPVSCIQLYCYIPMAGKWNTVNYKYLSEFL